MQLWKFHFGNVQYLQALINGRKFLASLTFHIRLNLGVSGAGKTVGNLSTCLGGTVLLGVLRFLHSIVAICYCCYLLSSAIVVIILFLLSVTDNHYA